ncbi:hypothetical protein GGR51DRAFT_569004 [Nemania sp. FL0031]|nr:hypothetical protein GGR51DRAFT_569004 [Nemania sp. FL0031]
MSGRSPVGRPIVGRPRRSRTVGSGETHFIDKTASSYHNQNGSIHDKHNVSFIPRVPRIPDRFLKKEHRDFGRAQDLVQDAEDEGEGEVKIDLKSIPAPHTRYLPNCSFGKPQAVQVLSNAMMQAYLAMRGNCLGGQDGIDPLFEWIQRREELARAYLPKIHGERDISKMLKLIDKALLSSTARGDSPREARFEVYRPDFEHIKPPQDMDMSANEFDACCADFEWKDDSDDDEADVPSGRISPCTFLEWSKDCVRWNANENEKKDTTSYIRVRPNTPKPSTAPKRHERPPSDNTIPQWDIYTGDELTPAYYVPTSPSIIYTPPGVEFTGFKTANFHAQYRRMAPLVDRELRSKLYGAREGPPYLPSSERASFSISEVNSAAAIMPELHNRAGPELEMSFQSQWAAIAQAEAAEKALYKEAERQRLAIKQLQLDCRHLNEFLPALHVHRELRDREQRDREAKLRQMQEEGEKERKEREMQMGMGKVRHGRRGEVIRAYVAEHALDIQSRLDMACFRLQTARAGVGENLARIAGLEREVRELCDQAGVRDPEHAYAVLMGAKSDDGGDAYKAGNTGGQRVDVHVGGNVNGYAPNGYDYGYGYGYGCAGAGTGVGACGNGGGPIGPWSDSSLGRAEEEYDRFLADMHMIDAGGRTSSKEWEARYDDDESSDSGVSGLGARDRYRSHY